MNIKEIIQRLIKKSRLGYCAICGKCLAVCPTYRELNEELHSPRGRLNLIKAYLDAELRPVGEKFFEALDWCLLCGACNTICPAQIQPAEAILYARALPEFRLRQSFWEKIILQKMVTRQTRLSVVNTTIRLAQKTGVFELLRRSKLRRFLPSHLLVMSELIPLQTGKSLTPYLQQTPKLIDKSNRSAHPPLTFFIGCAMNLILSEVLSDSLRLLNSANFIVKIPPEFYCCGAPHLHEGDIQTALSLCKTNVKILAEMESEIITSDCDSCVAMLKKYSELLAGTELEEQAAQVSKRTLALSELLARSDITSLEFENFGNVRVTWDDPCELIHAQGVSQAP
ncbi:MAG: (Fe-S)-binding protein, partial [Candidatus Sumerlaeia bacterium]|nr:(Fe-S)-binding protein [Candidatus Sumerlaeia bacterium]